MGDIQAFTDAGPLAMVTHDDHVAALATKDGEIAELSRKYDMWRRFVEVMSDQVNDLIAKLKQAESERDEVQNKYADLDSIYRRVRDDCDKARGDIAELHRERDESRRHLGELLAVIHRDGGQYQAENGAAKATQDALAKLSSLRCELYELRGEYDETAALFGAWKQRAEQAESEREDARECVKRLCETLTAIRDSTCTSATTLRGHAGVVLAATPEHLRR